MAQDVREYQKAYQKARYAAIKADPAKHEALKAYYRELVAK